MLLTAPHIRRPWHQTKPPPGAQIDWGHPLAQSLAACLLMPEGSGILTRDLARQSNGTLTNGPLWGTGPYGRTLVFDGVNDAVACGHIPQFESGDMTFVARAILTNVSTNRVFCRQWTLSGTKGPLFFHLGDDLCLQMGSASGRVTAADILPASQWIMVAGTAKGNVAKVFLNGVERASASVTRTEGDATAEFHISYTTTEGGIAAFLGTISHVYAWSRALSPSEIAELYGNPFAFIRPPAQTLYFFGGGAGTTAEMSGSFTAALTASGNLTGTASLSGSATASLTATGNLTGTASLSSSATISLSGSGNLTGTSALSGSSAITLTATGSMSEGQLSGSFTISLTASGNLDGPAATPAGGGKTIRRRARIVGRGRLELPAPSMTATGTVSTQGSASIGISLASMRASGSTSWEDRDIEDAIVAIITAP